MELNLNSNKIYLGILYAVCNEWNEIWINVKLVQNVSLIVFLHNLLSATIMFSSVCKHDGHLFKFSLINH